MIASMKSHVRFRAALVPAAAAALVCAVVLPAAHGQSIVNIGVSTGGSSSGASAVSADGHAVAATVDMMVAHRWTSAGLADLGTLPGSIGGSADGISADGSAIVGTAFWVDPEETIRAYRWTSSGGMVNLGVLPGHVASLGNGISGDGSVVTGASFDSDFNSVAFRWTSAGGMQSLGVVPGGTSSEGRRVSHDGSTIVGVSDTPGGSRAFAWTSSAGMQVLSPLSATDANWSAFGVNATGSVVAGFSGTSAVIWNNGLAQSLGILPGQSQGIAYTVSADGTMAGGTSFFGSSPTATLWTEQLGLVDLNVYLASLGVDLTGWHLGYTRDISFDGTTIVGDGQYNGESRGWVVTIPSPGTAGLLALGGLMVGRRRRN